MRAAYTSLANHPYAGEVRAVQARLPYLNSTELHALAETWRDTPAAAAARDRALRPDTPLVLDTLRVFEDVSVLFSEDLLGETAVSRSLGHATLVNALRAVRDAVAASIARPVLARRHYRVLMRPWSLVGVSHPPAPSESVMRAIHVVSSLGGRCHDPIADQRFEQVLAATVGASRGDLELALAKAFARAEPLGRHRSWALIRRDIEQAVCRRCPKCPPTTVVDAYERERVATAGADAVCALLVSDALDGEDLDQLLGPFRNLIPYPRPPQDA